MDTPVVLKRLENKSLSERELGRYFDTKSPDDLLLTLRRIKREGLCDFEVSLSTEYYNKAKAHRDVLLRTDVLQHYDPFGVLQRDKYGLAVKSDTPLSERDIVDVMSKLPPELAERYLRFKMTNITTGLYAQLSDLYKSHGGDDDEFYDRVDYGGLVVDGIDVTYDGEPIDMGFQHRQALRVLIAKKGDLCFKDEFTDATAGIFKQPPKDHALRNLIYEIRTALRSVTGKVCIKNTPGEGWSLKIVP